MGANKRRRCRVGLTCDHEVITCRRGLPSPRFVVPETYVRAVVHAGGVPSLLPHRPLDGAEAAAMLADVDALIFCGGDFDIPPHLYGQQVRPRCGRLLPERSTFELQLLRAALRADLPLLGVCGGMQLLNVATGGTLYQDLSERAHTGVHEQPHDRTQPQHAVVLQPHTQLHALFAGAELQVNSTHHQLVDALGSSLVVAGRADDGAIEAIEVTGARFALGVQWHPEAMGGAQWQIYEALVAAGGGAL